MFISRIALDIDSLAVIRLISSPYRIHAVVERSFSPDAVRANDAGRILWRLDTPTKRDSLAKLYVVSPDVPDFSGLINQVGEDACSDAATKDYSPVFDMLSSRRVWQFRLKANPVRKVLSDKGRRSREGIVGTTQAHVTPAQQAEWLISRSTDHGFHIVEAQDGVPYVDVSQRSKEVFKRNQMNVTVSTAVFDGRLEIVDPELFRKTLCFGVGREKSFGCGLITIAPIQSE